MPLPLFLGLAAAATAGAKVIKNQIEKSNSLNEIIAKAEEHCKQEAQAYKQQKTPTPFQKKMFILLQKHTFTTEEKESVAPIDSDWGHLPTSLKPIAVKKHSLFGWGDYSFYTEKAAYYHCKKKGIHECLYYDYINTYNPFDETIDYGPDHQERSLAQWDPTDQAILNKVAHIWSMHEKNDTSILEFCFNNNWEFKSDLRYLKTKKIRNTFHRVLRRVFSLDESPSEFFDHIKIASMLGGKIELQFWYYFPLVENVTYCEDDTEEEIREKEWEQELREKKAEELQEEVYRVHQALLENEDDIIESIAESFQQTLFELYGVLFEKENITFLDEPDFTNEKPSLIERVEGFTNSVQAFASDYVEKNCK